MASFLVLLLFTCGCSEEHPPVNDDSALFESEKKQMATETIRQMLELTEEYNWPELIKQHYGEYHKIKNTKQFGKLQANFEHGLARELQPILQKALNIEPLIQGDTALFKIDDETIYQLYWEDNRRWVFHLQ